MPETKRKYSLIGGNLPKENANGRRDWDDSQVTESASKDSRSFDREEVW